MPRKSSNITNARKDIKHWPPKEYKRYVRVAIVIHYELGKQLTLDYVDKCYQKKTNTALEKKNHKIFYLFNT